MKRLRRFFSLQHCRDLRIGNLVAFDADLSAVAGNDGCGDGFWRAVQTGKVEQVPDEQVHTVGLLEDVLQPFVFPEAVLQNLRVCVDDGEGRF